LATVRRLQHSQIIQLIGGHVMPRENLRSAEKVALKQRIAVLSSSLEIGIGLHFFGKHANIAARVFAAESSLQLRRRLEEIHLDAIGKVNELAPFSGIHEIVKRD